METEIHSQMPHPALHPPTQDIIHSFGISEYGSVSKHRHTKADLCLHEDMLRSFNCEENVREHHLWEEDKPFLLSSKPETKSLNRKSLKMLSSFSCSKRSRIDQANDSIVTAVFDDHNAKKIGYDHVIRARADEKCRSVRQKRGLDHKKIDKKSIQANLKTKFDPFTIKPGFIGSATTSGGDNIIGTCALKSDIHDVTNHAEELSLEELLDGSCNYPKLSVDRGKKASTSNDNILLSVRNACSILLNPCSPSTNISDNDEKDKCVERLFSKNAFQAVSSSLSLYHPKDILDHLALPLIQDLEARMLKEFCPASLLPYCWSYSLGGDSCKLTLPRNESQSKWLKIGSCSTSVREENNSFSKFDLEKLELELKTLGFNDDCAHEQMTKSDAADNHVGYESKDNDLQNYFESEVGLRGLQIVGPPESDYPFKEIEVGEVEKHKIMIDDCSGSCCGYPRGESLCKSTTPELCNSVHSPNLLAAASILCKMAHNGASMTMKSPKALSNRNPVDHKSSSTSMENTERLFVASRHCDIFKCPGLPSTSERNHVSSIRLEKVFDHHRKHRQDTFKASSFGFGGTWIKDWCRGRSKRV